MIARIASLTRWATERDRTAATAKMRAARRAQFERRALEANPGLTGDELARAADHLMRAHMLRMRLKATQARRKARENDAKAEAVENELAEFTGGAA